MRTGPGSRLLWDDSGTDGAADQPSSALAVGHSHGTEELNAELLASASGTGGSDGPAERESTCTGEPALCRSKHLGDWRSAAAYASVNTLTGHAGARMAGLDNSFSWRSVAANAVTASITSSVTGRLGKALQVDTTTVGGQFGQDLLGGAVGGVVGIHTRRAAGMEQGVNYGQVAVDAFGNALANAATGEHSRRALAALESQHRADLINAELQGRLAEGELQGAALAQALGRMGLPSDPRAHDGLWDRLPADGSRVLLDQRQGSNANGTPWTEQDWARRINDSYERRRFGGARVDFNTVRTDGVRDRRPAQVEALPPFIAAPPRSPGWSLSQQIGLNFVRGTGAVVGVGKMVWDGAVGTLAGANTFAQAGMYQVGLAGVMDGWLGGNSYAMAGLQAGDRLGAGIQGLLDFAGSDYKGQIIADGIFSRFDDAAAKLSSQDPLTAFKGGIGIGQLTAEVGTSVYGGFQMARGGVGFAGRTADNFAELSKGKLYSAGGAFGDVAKAAWDAALGKRSGTVANVADDALGPPVPRVNVADEFIVTSNKNGSVTLKYGNPEGVHGLIVNVDRQGVLGFDIRSAPGGSSFSNASGTDMFASAMQRLDREGVRVNAIRGVWVEGTDSINSAQYLSGLGRGLSPQQAAANTWTGRMAARYGYTNIGMPSTGYSATTFIFGR